MVHQNVRHLKKDQDVIILMIILKIYAVYVTGRVKGLTVEPLLELKGLTIEAR